MTASIQGYVLAERSDCVDALDERAGVGVETRLTAGACDS